MIRSFRTTLQLGYVSRNFSSSSFLLKKKPAEASKTGTAKSEPADPKLDTSALKNALESTLKSFAEKVKEAKSNAVSTDKFQSLQVDLGHGSSSPLKSIAAIAARGNKINIVAFDPKQIKRIQTAIVSEMGIPAELSDNNKQSLSVTIPQQTEAKKATTAKLIKDAFEGLRNNAGDRNSLANIRAKYIAPLKKAATKSSGVSKDEVKKQTQEVEQLVKLYSEKLQDLYKKST